MLHKELIQFRKVPRNDIMMFLYEQNNISNIYEIYERLNQPIITLKLILDDLINNSLIKVDKRNALYSIQGSFLDRKFEHHKIELTEKGKDYVICTLLGLNSNKYRVEDPIEYLTIITPNASINYRLYFNKSFKEFWETGLARNIGMDKYQLYYILTGKIHKENQDKKLFISYAHDETNKNKKWVNEFANRLQEIFVVEYDANLSISMNPYDYMKNGILSSDYVLIIFDKNYKNKYENQPESGVRYEFSIIEDSLFKKIGRAKYISILKEGSLSESIPKSMSETLYCDFRNENEFEDKLQELINEIKN